MANKNPNLSVIILNYNSATYLLQCLQSIFNSELSNRFVEIIVVDNDSTDTSFAEASTIVNTNNQISIQFLKLDCNLGFAAGNNKGLKLIHPDSPYVLFLNPDTTVETDTFLKMIEFFDENCQVAAATCKIILALTNKLQPECHRGFPTPWRSFCHFSGLSKLFPKTKYFDGYFLGHLDTNITHEIEACVGAFLMVRREVGGKLGWWNEKYFFYGEDLDFCYKLKKLNYKLYYYPGCSITHYQGISSGLISKTKKLSAASRQTKVKVALASTKAMRIFYEENLLKEYPLFLKPFVLLAIKLLEIQRIIKAKFL